MHRLAVLCALALSLAAQTASAASFDSLISFGDSLSDTGSGPATPPSYGGRYSNGPVWEEYLAGSLGIGAAQTRDYAIGGALTGSTPTGLLTQTAGYAAAPVALGSSTLFTVWAGGNDAFSTASGGDPLAIMAQAAANVASAVMQLAGAGAQYFLVPNLPNGGLFPATILLGVDPNAANLLTQFFNSQLDAALAPLTGSLGVTIYRLDTYALYQAIVGNPAGYGFTNWTQACRTGAGTCANPDEYLFWDTIHPTTRAHQFIAAAALQAVPEPESLVLVAVLALAALSSRCAGRAASRRIS